MVGQTIGIWQENWNRFAVFFVNFQWMRPDATDWKPQIRRRSTSSTVNWTCWPTSSTPTGKLGQSIAFFLLSMKPIWTWTLWVIYWVLLVFIEFDCNWTGRTRFWLGFTGFYWVLLGFCGVSLGLVLDSTGFYYDFLVSIWFDCDWTGYTRVWLGFIGFYRVLLGLVRFYWLLLCFLVSIWFHLVLQWVTGEFYWVLLGFT